MDLLGQPQLLEQLVWPLAASLGLQQGQKQEPLEALAQQQSQGAQEWQNQEKAQVPGRQLQEQKMFPKSPSLLVEPGERMREQMEHQKQLEQLERVEQLERLEELVKPWVAS